MAVHEAINGIEKFRKMVWWCINRINVADVNRRCVQLLLATWAAPVVIDPIDFESGIFSATPGNASNPR